MSTSISSLTQDELSRWICAHLDPHPVFHLSGEWWFSLSRVWITTAYTSDTQTSDIHHRSYTDPEICLRLLKALLTGRDFECLIGPDEIEMSWRPSAVKYGQSFMVSLIKNDLERGIAEAYARANSYCPEGGE